MRVVDPGHSYLLEMLDRPEGDDSLQPLWFVKREGDGYPGNVGHGAGTTSQEVLRALIERGEYVNQQIPCAETEAAVGLMKAALLLLELRAARRHGRMLDLPHLDLAALTRTCGKCGHVGCEGACRP